MWVVGFLALALGAASWGATGDGALGAGALAARLLVVAVKPLLVALIKVVGEAIGDAVSSGLFDSD